MRKSRGKMENRQIRNVGDAIGAFTGAPQFQLAGRQERQEEIHILLGSDYLTNPGCFLLSLHSREADLNQCGAEKDTHSLALHLPGSPQLTLFYSHTDPLSEHDVLLPVARTTSLPDHTHRHPHKMFGPSTVTSAIGCGYWLNAAVRQMVKP